MWAAGFINQFLVQILVFSIHILLYFTIFNSIFNPLSLIYLSPRFLGLCVSLWPLCQCNKGIYYFVLCVHKMAVVQRLQYIGGFKAGVSNLLFAIYLTIVAIWQLDRDPTSRQLIPTPALSQNRAAYIQPVKPSTKKGQGGLDRNERDCVCVKEAPPPCWRKKL